MLVTGALLDKKSLNNIETKSLAPCMNFLKYNNMHEATVGAAAAVAAAPFSRAR